MIVAKYQGGLGNQLFQLAAAFFQSYERELGGIIHDSSFFNNYATHRFELNCLGIRPTSGFFLTKKLSRKRITKLCPNFLATEVNSPEQILFPEKSRACIYVNRGYFQDYRITDPSINRIKNLLIANVEHSFLNSAAVEKVRSSDNSVMIHIRRGDYVSNKSANAVHGLLNMDYYKLAIKHVNQRISNPKYFVFSDDPDWVREQEEFGGNQFEIMEISEKPALDLYLMSKCRNHIIGNSTFSWWGATLSGYQKNLISPINWVANSAVREPNIFEKKWTRI